MYTYHHYGPTSASGRGEGRARVWQQRWLSIVIAAVFLTASLVAIAGWYLRYGQTGHILSVQTGSMAPSIQAGDAVVVQKVSADELRPGDVVSFYAADEPVTVTHRLISYDSKTGMMRTQGDMNASADQPVEAALLVGRVTRLLPNVGHILDAVRSPAGLVLGVYVPAAVIVFTEVRRLAAYYYPGYRHPAGHSVII